MQLAADNSNLVEEVETCDENGKSFLEIYRKVQFTEIYPQANVKFVLSLICPTPMVSTLQPSDMLT
jgi:hypothetical protein